MNYSFKIASQSVIINIVVKEFRGAERCRSLPTLWTFKSSPSSSQLWYFFRFSESLFALETWTLQSFYLSALTVAAAAPLPARRHICYSLLLRRSNRCPLPVSAALCCHLPTFHNKTESSLFYSSEVFVSSV